MNDRQLTTDQPGSTYIRVGAVASVLLAALLLTLFAMTASLSTLNPRTDSAGFLADVQDQVTLLQASVWVAAGFSVMVGPFFFGLYQALRPISEDLMRVSLISGVIAMIVGGMLVALEAAGAGFIVPAWSAAETAAQKDALFYDFQAVAWGLDATSRMFDLFIVTGSIFASVVMLRSGLKWLRAVAWLGLGSAVIHLPGVVLLIFFEAMEPVHFLADITFLVWVLGAGVGMWRLSVTKTAAEQGGAVLQPSA